MHANIPLSKLVSGRFNPRRVKPERDAHRRMVASVRAHGLLEPLIVRYLEDSDQYLVIAGGRRLAALREVYRGKDPKIACQVRNEGDAEAISLAENFGREPMHPLDEAEAFARLVREEDKDVAAVSSDFGVTPGYVRQRMKLATLSDPVKSAYRQGAIDTGTAEAFAAVPEDKQLEVWAEFKSPPQHADHVRNVIANAWIDAKHAIFDLAFLPPEKISRDLFADRVLIERQVFMAAQSEALNKEQHSLKEDGWSDIVVAPQADVQDLIWRMDEAPVVFDEKITKKLVTLEEKREGLEAKLEEVTEGDQAAFDVIQEKFDAVDTQLDELTKDAEVHYEEAVKAVGTVFLILDPDGRVRREYRVPKTKADSPSGTNGSADSGKPLDPPTPDDLSDKQKATLYTIQAIAVRQSLLDSPLCRKRVLAMILHEKVRSEALAIRHDANGTNNHIQQSEGFSCPALDTLRAKHAEVDPFKDDHFLEDKNVYARLSAFSEEQLDALIELLTVECLTAHLARPTEIICILANELSVKIRQQWRPDTGWLGNYQKLQLATLIGTLLGPVHGPVADNKKKSELVEQAAALFADAAEGRFSDPEVANRINQWLPAEMLRASTSGSATTVQTADPQPASNDGVLPRRTLKRRARAKA